MEIWGGQRGMEGERADIFVDIFHNPAEYNPHDTIINRRQIKQNNVPKQKEGRGAELQNSEEQRQRRGVRGELL